MDKEPIEDGDDLWGQPTLMPLLEAQAEQRKALGTLAETIQDVVNVVQKQNAPPPELPAIVIKRDEEKGSGVTEQEIQYLKAFEGSTFSLQRRIVRTVRELAEEQMDEVLEKLRRIRANLSGTEMKDAIDNFLFDEEIWVAKFAEGLEPLVLESAVEGAAEKAATFNIAATFDVTNPTTIAYLNQFSSTKVKGIVEDTAKQLRKALGKGIAEGEGVRDLARRVGKVERQLGGTRAYTIARTETTAGANFGATELYKEGGVEKKSWLSSMDDRVRTYAEGEYDHESVDSPIDTNQQFEVSGELLQYPGDAAGSAGNVINCRCTVIPVME